MTQFTVLNGGSKLLIRVWSPFCSNWNYHQVCMGGVSVRITKMISLRVKASLMNKGKVRSIAFGLVSVPGSFGVDGSNRCTRGWVCGSKIDLTCTSRGNSPRFRVDVRCS